MHNKRESQHFSKLWNYVLRAANYSIAECDEEFVEECHVICHNNENEVVDWKAAVEVAYRSLRSKLEKECYGTDNHERTLDPSKTAAVVCCALIKEKAVSFGEDQAINMLVQKEAEIKDKGVDGRIALNHWIVDNFFVNYKIAYLSGLMILFDTLLGELLHDPATAEYGKKLADLGRIQRYPRRPKFDNFDVNLVLGLGRTDIERREINSFFLASQYYQMEMYTRLAIGLDRGPTDDSVPR